MNIVQPIRDQEKIEEFKQALLAKSDRDYMIFVTGINTGFRCGDMIKLKVKDVRGRDYINRVEQKTNKQRRLKITPSLKREFKKYTAAMDDDDFLFQSRVGKNKPLSRTQVYNILRAAAREIGIEEVGSHTMRKTFGYWFYKKYKDVALLQDLFNHASPAITLRYIGINQDERDRALDNFKI